MNKSSLTVLKGVSTIVGGAIAGPTGVLIGNLTGSLLQSFLPEAPEAVKGFTQDLINDLVKGLGKKAFSELKPEEQQLVNHDLQTAFRDAFIQAVYDIGGKKCFPVVWRKNPRIIPQSVIYSESTGHELWVNNDPLKRQVQDCLKDLVKAVEVGRVLPLDPPKLLPANDVRSYLESTSPEQLSDAFFDQVLQPFLDRYKTLLVELPDFLTRLKRHLLDRTLVYLGENLKKRTPAWRAYNRMVLEQYRSQLTDLGKGQEEISKRIDNLLQSGVQGGTDLSDGLANLLSAIGTIEKKLDEQLSSILDRVVDQHRELVQSLEQLTTTSLRIESKVDRVLRILEDGHLVVEGLPPVAMNIPPEPGEAPFQGMQFFDEKDAGRFFGREKLVAKLTCRLCSTRFLTVVGASGSGKSSLVRAGLLPTLRSGKPLMDGTLPPEGCKDWQIQLITPGEHPLETLAVSLTNSEDSLIAAAKLQDDFLQEARSLTLAIRRISQGKSTKHKILLVIDQFEELFTLCRDETERQAFLENLVSAITPENVGPLKVVITLRADFYDECGRYPQLRTLLQENQEYIGPMSLEELRSAIEEPARQGNWEFERGLVDLILRDVGEEPGALPLLSHALLETWNHRRGRMMTLESYAEAGGVRGAIAQTAETVYQKRLTVEQQTIARSIFLRLTELGEGTQDTRRRVALNELVAATGKQAEIESVMTALVDARLITTTEDSAEVAHEALIREWPLLRNWLSEDRETLRLADGVRSVAREWQRGDKDVNLLIHRGGRLEEALELPKNGEYSFNPQETEYLEACQKLVEGERLASERLRRRLTIASVVIAIVMLVLGIWGLNRAREATNQAATAIAERDRAENMTHIARSRQLAAEANSTLHEFPIRSLLLSIEALRYSTPRQPQAEESLREGLKVVGGIPLPRYEDYYTLTISLDGRRLAAGCFDNAIRIWDIQNPTADPIVLLGHEDKITNLLFSPDGRWLTSASDDYTVQSWDLQNPDIKPSVINRPEKRINLFSISNDGHWLVIVDQKYTRLWDMQNPSFEPLVLFGNEQRVTSVSFSSDGRWLAVGIFDNKNWDITTQLRDMQNLTAKPIVLIGFESLSSSLAFSPDGNLLVTGGIDNSVILWDTKNPLTNPIGLRGHEGYIETLAFSPDGLWLATGSRDNTARIWDLKNLSAEPIILRGHEGPIYSLSFSPDGLWLATGSEDKSARIWKIRNPGAVPIILRGSEGTISTLSFSHDGRWLLAESGNKTARLWDTQNLAAESLVLRGHQESINTLAFSPDGYWLATGSDDKTVRLWDMKNTSDEPIILRGHEQQIKGLTFSPDGHFLATCSFDNTVRLWNMKNITEEPKVLRGHDDSIWVLAFSPDGHFLATGGWDNTVRLWNMLNPAFESILFYKSNTAIIDLAFSLDNRWLAIDRNGDSVLWIDIQNPTAEPVMLRQYESVVYTLAFNPDGQWLATGSADKTARLWNTQNLTAEPVVLFGHDSGINSLTFSKDGRWLATGSEDKTTRIWDMQNTVAEPVVLRGHNGSITSLEFSPDGRFLASGSVDHTARLWEMDLNSLVEKACLRAGRNLSQAEWERYFSDEEYHKTCPQFPSDS